jgi:predicted outer membrane protein
MVCWRDAGQHGGDARLDSGTPSTAPEVLAMNRHSLLTGLSLLLATGLAAAQSAPEPVRSATTSKPPATVLPPAPSRAQVPSPGQTNLVAPEPAAQAEALSFLQAIDQHEIAVAEQARGKKLEVAVRNFARMLRGEHAENLAQTHALAAEARIKLLDTPDVAAQRDKGKASLVQLAKLDGAEYASAFLDAMIAGHTEALALIDSRLLPAAIDADIKAHIEATRIRVAAHLGKAQELKSAGK